MKGLSERIRVRSIVGRFLEHSRIFCFANGGKEEIYCGSADWMPRNLVERCEVVFPVTQPDLHKRLREEILAAYLADNTKARLLQPDGEYVRAPKVGSAVQRTGLPDAGGGGARENGADSCRGWASESFCRVSPFLLPARKPPGFNDLRAGDDLQNIHNKWIDS